MHDETDAGFPFASPSIVLNNIDIVCWGSNSLIYHTIQWKFLKINRYVMLANPPSETYTQVRLQTTRFFWDLWTV